VVSKEIACAALIALVIFASAACALLRFDLSRAALRAK
jgi:hypothetical protein